MLVYCVYILFLRYKFFTLLKAYAKMISRANKFTMVKAIYNFFVVILILELAMEEYKRMRMFVNFVRRISLKTKIRCLKKANQ